MNTEFLLMVNMFKALDKAQICPHCSGQLIVHGFGKYRRVTCDLCGAERPDVVTEDKWERLRREMLEQGREP